MTYEEFHRQIGKAGLTLTEFANLIRMNRASISNLAAKGEVPAHLAIMACLMGEMAEYGLDFRPPLVALDIAPKKPRGGAAKGRFGGSRQTDLFVEGARGWSAVEEQSKNISGNRKGSLR